MALPSTSMSPTVFTHFVLNVSLFSVSRRNSRRYLRTLRRFMFDLLTDVSEAALVLVTEATNPVLDYLRLRRYTRLRQKVERWFYSHL